MRKQLKNLFSLQRLHEEFVAVLKRFPLSVATAVLLFLYITLEIHGVELFDNEWSARIVLSGLMSFYWFLAVKLYRENHDLTQNLYYGATFIGFLVIVAINFFYDLDNYEYQPVLILGAIFLMVFVAPFIRKEPDNFSFWEFCKTAVLGIGLGLLAAIIFFLGSLAIVMSIQFLFDIKFDDDLMITIWMFCALLLGPLYTLSFIPQKFVTAERECSLPTQIGFIANWILAPLAAIYILVLYAYFIKIGVTWTLPKGEIAYIVGGFALTGIVTYLVAWVFDAVGKSSKLLSFIMRNFFKLMIIPVMLMAFAIYIRIDEYGVTPDRYLVVSGVLWFVFLTVGFLIQKLSLKHIVLSLIALLFIVSIGPWNMNNISLWSQKNRFENLLQKHNLLDDDKLIKAENGEEIPLKDRVQISSIVDFLSRGHWGDNDYLRDVLYGAKDSTDFFKQVGFEYARTPRYSHGQDEERFNYYFTNNKHAQALEVRGYDYVVHNAWFNRSNAWGDVWAKRSEDDEKNNIKDYQLRGHVFDNVLRVYFPPHGEGSVDLAPIVEKLRANDPYIEERSTLKITVNGERFTADIILSSIGGAIENEEPEVQSLNGYALIKIR